MWLKKPSQGSLGATIAPIRTNTVLESAMTILTPGAGPQGPHEGPPGAPGCQGHTIVLTRTKLGAHTVQPSAAMTIVPSRAGPQGPHEGLLGAPGGQGHTIVRTRTKPGTHTVQGSAAMTIVPSGATCGPQWPC